MVTLKHSHRPSDLSQTSTDMNFFKAQFYFVDAVLFVWRAANCVVDLIIKLDGEIANKVVDFD